MTNITRLNKIKNTVKKKIEKNKKLFLIGAITMAGLSISQKAEAQEGPYRKDATFVDANELIGFARRDTTEYFSGEILANALQGVSREKIEKFKNSYFSKLNDQLEVTPGDLVDAFIEADFTDKEIDFATKSIIKSQSRYKDNKTIDNDLEQDIGKTPTGVTFTKIRNENATLEYACFNQGEIIIKGTSAVNTNTLLPNVYQDNLGGFRCGASLGPDASTVIKKEKLALQDLVLRNEVYKHLATKETLTPAEQSFVAGFPAQLPKHGLSVDKKGNLIQKDYIERLQKMQNRQND